MFLKRIFAKMAKKLPLKATLVGDGSTSVSSTTAVTVKAGPFSMNVSGGMSPFSFGWQITSGTGFTILPSGNTCSASALLGPSQSAAGTVTGTVTDKSGAKATVTMPISLTNVATAPAPTPTPPAPTPVPTPVPPAPTPVPSAFPPLGPGPSYTGVPGSGYAGAPPVDPVRTTAKPRLQWWTPNFQRVWNDQFTVGVFASAEGGIQKVRLYGEGGVVDLTAMTTNTYTNLRGETNTEVGYFATLSVSQFLAITGSGTAQLYAEAIANDPTMQHRVIGPLTVYPRATEVDWSKTFGVGGDYATYDDAANALAAAYNAGQVECGRMRCISSGTYYLLDPKVRSINISKGYTILDAAPGVDCNLVRRDVFDPNNAWDTWASHMDNMCIGPGVRIDVMPLRMIHGGSRRPWWIRGGQFYNSIGARDTLYWNNAPHPGLVIFVSEGSGDVPVNWSDGAQCSYGGCPVNQVGAGALKKFSYSKDAVGCIYFDQPFIANCYERGSSVKFFRIVKDMFSVTYKGTGTGAMRIDRPGGIYLTLMVNGADVKQFQLTRDPGAGVYSTVSALCAAINAYGQGFSATTISDTYCASAAGGASSGFVQALGATPFVQNGFFDYHTEWYHCFAYGLLENVVIYANDIRDADYSTAFFNSETGLADSHITGNSFVGNGNSGCSFGKSHVTVDHNYIPTGIFLFDPASNDPYTRIRANILGGIGAYNYTFPTAVSVADNLYQLGWQGAPTSPNYVNNQVVTDITTCVVDAVNDDLRPTGVGATSLVDAAFPYDQTGALRSLKDARGPLSINAAQKVHPF
jgi:hypothetical protein